MTLHECQALVADAVRAASASNRAHNLEPSHRLVADLGFDSLRVSILALELESRLGRPVLLDGWIMGIGSPDELTVGSLVRFLWEELDERAA